jgi:hypothetical protein
MNKLLRSIVKIEITFQLAVLFAAMLFAGYLGLTNLQKDRISIPSVSPTQQK